MNSMPHFSANKPLLKTLLAWFFASWLLVAALLSACGGGVGSGGSGTGVASFSEGIVSGLGSVIVDGTEFSDTLAAVQVQTAGGSSANTQVKLGQRVLVSYDSSNAASVIQVLPQLSGPASGAPDSSGWLKVAAQWVKLVDAASATASRPVTLISGYDNLSEIVAADELEIHGNWVLDSSLNAWILVATRLEKISTPGADVLVSGIVHSLPNSAAVRINAVNGTLLQASSLPANLKAGQLISAWIARSSWGASPLMATRIVLQGIASLGGVGDNLRVSGLASDYDASTNTVSVQGVRVSLPVVGGPDPSALRSGALLKVDGKGGALSMQASSASSSQGPASNAPLQVELKGVLSGINWNTSSVTLTLRNSTVVATASAIDKSCKQLADTADAYVQVKGSITPPSTTVQASSVTCGANAPSGATLQRSGILLSVSSSALSLQTSTRTDTGTLQMQVDANTFFEQPSASLIGQKVDVEGVLITGSSSLRAKTVKRARPAP